MKPSTLKAGAVLFGFVVGIVFALGVAYGFHLPVWPWCLLVLPAQMVTQLAASISFELFFDQRGDS